MKMLLPVTLKSLPFSVIFGLAVMATVFRSATTRSVNAPPFRVIFGLSGWKVTVPTRVPSPTLKVPTIAPTSLEANSPLDGWACLNRQQPRRPVDLEHAVVHSHGSTEVEQRPQPLVRGRHLVDQPIAGGEGGSRPPGQVCPEQAVLVSGRVVGDRTRGNLLAPGRVAAARCQFGCSHIRVAKLRVDIRNVGRLHQRDAH